MRFEVRWSNGYWKVIDLHSYTQIGIYTELRFAQGAASNANAQALLAYVKENASERDGDASDSRNATRLTRFDSGARSLEANDE